MRMRRRKFRGRSRLVRGRRGSGRLRRGRRSFGRRRRSVRRRLVIGQRM